MTKNTLILFCFIALLRSLNGQKIQVTPKNINFWQIEEEEKEKIFRNNNDNSYFVEFNGTLQNAGSRNAIEVISIITSMIKGGVIGKKDLYNKLFFVQDLEEESINLDGNEISILPAIHFCVFDRWQESEILGKIKIYYIPRNYSKIILGKKFLVFIIEDVKNKDYIFFQIANCCNNEKEKEEKIIDIRACY